MTVQEIIDRARVDITEINPQGRFGYQYFLDKLNEVLADRVVPDLYRIAGENLLYNYLITGSVDLSASTKNVEEWKEGDLSLWVDGSDDTYLFYPPSLEAMVDNGDYRVPVNFIPFIAGYLINYNLASHKPKVLGTLSGQTVYIYDNNYTTLYLQAIQIKDYTLSTDEVELDDYIARETLIPAMCSEAMIKDKGINMMNIFDMKYGKNLRRLERDFTGWQKPTEIVPRSRRGGFYGLRDRR